MDQHRHSELAARDRHKSQDRLGTMASGKPMNLTLPLTPAEGAKLLAKARSEGTTPEHLVRQAIDPMLASVPDEVAGLVPSQKLIAAEADRALDELLDTLPPMPSLSDKALSRESIYAPEDDTR